MRRSSLHVLLVPLTFLAARSIAPAAETNPDPTNAEVPLAAKGGWHASLIYDNDVGVWTVGTAQIFPQFGCPEVFGLDDKGRCTIAVSYSGKWTPLPTVQDGEWLGALEHFDLDPHLDGPEMYTGGKKGNLFQIRAHEEADFDTRIITRFPGEEIHTLVGGDLLPSRAGNELLAFSRQGVVWDVRPPDAPGGAFSAPEIARLGGRVRQAAVLPARAGEAPWIAATCRFGKVLLLRMGGGGLDVRVVVDEPMGFGRLAVRKSAPGEPVVLYASRDDGVILRCEGRPGQDDWRREIVYAGPQGPRGVAAGRFSADPNVETIAVFGYSKRVQLLSREPGKAWSVETIFEERDKGHWLATAELDGRNGTDELIASGYGARVVLLSRPPGYGIDGVITDPDEKEAERKQQASATGASPPPIRVAMRSTGEARRIDPIGYRGGFFAKTLVYETLVRRDAAGRIVPALAESWTFEDGGRSLVLVLREGARFHDGTPVDADSVATHVRRWFGLPEHGWLRSSERIRDVRARSLRDVVITMDRPHALLPDLAAINPCAVRGAGALDAQGEFLRPIGSGPFAYLESDERTATHRFRRVADGARVDLIAFPAESRIFDAFMAGGLDLIADGWYEVVPRDRIGELASDPGLCVEDAPGSSVWYLSFRLDGPTADVELRRALVGAVNRTELIQVVERGHADPCFGLAAPTVKVWPPARPRSMNTVNRVNTAATRGPELVLLVRVAETREQRIGNVVAEQFRRAGIACRVVAVDADGYRKQLATGDYDVRVEHTWGVPYDPYVTLTNRFLPPASRPNAAENRSHGVDPRIRELVLQATRTPDPNDLPAIYRGIQTLIDDEALYVPLLVPRRVLLCRSGVRGARIDHDLYRVDLSSLERAPAGADERGRDAASRR